jgi:hypothetical protein
MGEMRKRGRPPINGHDALGEFVQCRCSRPEKDLWTNAAHAKHLTLGEALRSAMTDWARDVLQLTEEEIAQALAEERADSVPPDSETPPMK